MAELTDAQWERVKPHLPPPARAGKVGRPRADDRACLEGSCRRPPRYWRDLQERAVTVTDRSCLNTW